MKLTFFTNYIHHHQIPIADEFYQILGDDYKFVASDPLPDWLIKGGYDSTISRPYLVRQYNGLKEREEAMQLMNESDVVLVGAYPENLITDRINSNKLTFRYSERWFKQKPWYMTGPNGWVNFYKNHIRYRNKPLYMLAASAYTANDVYSIGAYKNKVYKWGYFTKVENHDLEASLDVSRRERATILWCARFLSLKHPELPILMAKKLKDEGFAFRLDMIGSGEKYDETVALANSLGVDDVVLFMGNMPNEDVLKQMQQHQIFLFTSDRNEGWGAVLNESMSNGCAVVASNLIGSAPFLIEDGKNGLLFQSESVESLYSKVKLLLDNQSLAEGIAKNAMLTMRNTWSPKIAAERFVILASNLLNGEDTPFESGPCSKAYPYIMK